MAGIIDIGVRIPWRRLSGKAAQEAWGRPGAGERAVANYDEDSATLAVEAALECLGDRDPKGVEALYFASVSSPYCEKSAASLIAAAADLESGLRTQDIGGSLRGAASGLLSALDSVRAGAFRQALVAGADCRLAPPGSSLEMTFGDAGAAALVGKEDAVAVLAASASRTQELMDTWRTSDQRSVRTGDVRFNRVEAYTKCVVGACKALLEKSGMEPKQFSKVVLTSPDGKGHGGVAKALGVDPKAVVDPRTDSLGMLGNAQPLAMLASALESSAAGDKVLLACYGDGCDAMIFHVTEAVARFKQRGRLRSAAAPLGYVKYLAYKQLLAECQDDFRPFASPIQSGREQGLSLRFHGLKCHKCATVNTLNLRVCPHCGTKDDFETVKLAKRGILNTYTQEHFYPTPEPPVTMAVVDLEGGARYLSQMTDVEPGEVKVGMPVRMTFRRLHEGGGYHNYCWKCRPVREA